MVGSISTKIKNMGMDLRPVRPTKDAPLRADGKVKWGRYSWSGWGDLVYFLQDHGVDVSEFAGSNDGDRIKSATCKQIAHAIESNFDEYLKRQGGELDNESDIEVCKLDILLWRTCGGYRQH
jgi:hypothetical protein